MLLFWTGCNLFNRNRDLYSRSRHVRMAFFNIWLGIAHCCSTFVETELLSFVGTEATCVLTHCVDEIYSDKSSSEAPLFTNSLFFFGFSSISSFFVTEKALVGSQLWQVFPWNKSACLLFLRTTRFTCWIICRLALNPSNISWLHTYQWFV